MHIPGLAATPATVSNTCKAHNTSGSFQCSKMHTHNHVNINCFMRQPLNEKILKLSDQERQKRVGQLE